MTVSLRDNILDTAVEPANHSSWEALHLRKVASAVDISADELHQHFAVKDELGEDWYDRADSAMLQAAETPEFAASSVRERLHALIMAWLDFLDNHKTVSRDMLLYKLEPAHSTCRSRASCASAAPCNGYRRPR